MHFCNFAFSPPNPRFFQGLSFFRSVSQLKGNDRRYTSKETENEVHQIIVFKILREIADEIQTAEFFTIMAEKGSDASNITQLVVCLR